MKVFKQNKNVIFLGKTKKYFLLLGETTTDIYTDIYLRKQSEIFSLLKRTKNIIFFYMIHINLNCIVSVPMILGINQF